MKSENIYKLALAGIFTVMSVIGGFIVDKFTKQNDLIREQNELINKVYVRQAAMNQRMDDEGMFKTTNSRIDSLIIKNHLK